MKSALTNTAFPGCLDMVTRRVDAVARGPIREGGIFTERERFDLLVEEIQREGPHALEEIVIWGVAPIKRDAIGTETASASY